MCQAKPHSQNSLCHFGVRESCSRFNGVSVGSCVERGTRSSAHHPVKSGGKTAALQNFQGERLANGSEAKKKPLTEGARGKRVVSGMRPTGRLHIGHYFGALQNWVRLQNDPSYDCFYFIADWHALTSDYADTSGVAQNVIEIATDYLAVGLDPKKCIIFQQSQIPEHAELHLLLSMVTPLGWLERVPTYKEALENVKDRDLHTYGFLGYPCLQAADIVIYSEEGVLLVVPVGEDQVSHVEVTREIVRHFVLYFGLEVDGRLFSQENKNALRDAIGIFGQIGTPAQYLLGTMGELTPFERGLALTPETLSGAGPQLIAEQQRKGPSYAIPEDVKAYWVGRIKRKALEEGIDNFLSTLKSSRDFIRKRPAVLSEPEVMLTQTPRIPGLDGRKMSKSYGNAITLSESDADIRAKTKVMVTDPARKRRSDPGNPDVCPVYDWHKLFSPAETLKWSAEGCRTAGIGCIECKAAMADNLIQWIAPIRERRVEYEKNPKRVLEVIDQGSQKARRIAQQAMTRVREAVFGWEKKRKEISDGGTAANA